MTLLLFGLALLVNAFLLYRARAWLGEALSEPTGEPSASRLVAFLCAVVPLTIFFVGMLVQIWSERKLPSPGEWSTALGWAATGGAVPYAVNKIAKVVGDLQITKKE